MNTNPKRQITNFRKISERHYAKEIYEHSARKLKVGRSRKVLISKLHLEGNSSDLIIYLQAIRDSIKTLIRKLPTNLFCILAHHEIPDLRTLINISQNEGIYEEHANAYMKQNF